MVFILVWMPRISSISKTADVIALVHTVAGIHCILVQSKWLILSPAWVWVLWTGLCSLYWSKPFSFPVMENPTNSAEIILNICFMIFQRVHFWDCSYHVCTLLCLFLQKVWPGTGVPPSGTGVNPSARLHLCCHRIRAQPHGRFRECYWLLSYGIAPFLYPVWVLLSEPTAWKSDWWCMETPVV